MCENLNNMDDSARKEKQQIEDQIKALEAKMNSLESSKKTLAEQLAKLKQNETDSMIEDKIELSSLIERKPSSEKKERKNSILSVDWNSGETCEFSLFTVAEEEKISDENTEPNTKVTNDKIEKWPLEKLKEEMKKFGMKTGTKVIYRRL